ncbi:hypothetical protein BCR36DRAFT_366330 [Piromyces finnis]|uniref:Uncharacterized protein n=1 Tax=Piromyces finnis TaxID=1754191 RepID=A0A1Y1VMM9_9FUNG|nr:hypothetical protein BCR36DRAFT_366330 [Piromyces finnis]|eukprot:ORX59144.1 hypothetical protein BCR36DRAFT_366330 [Piromyces finnis]
MEYTIVHEQEIVNTCQAYLEIRNKSIEGDTNNDEMIVRHINEFLFNSLILEVILDAIKSRNKSLLQEDIIIFCNLIHNLDYIKITQLFLSILSIIKSNIDYEVYISLIKEIFPTNLSILFDLLKDYYNLNKQNQCIKEFNENNISCIKLITHHIKKSQFLKPIFSTCNIYANENQMKLSNINYQDMYHQLSMSDWLWFWINILFNEIKIDLQKSLCQHFIQGNNILHTSNNEVLNIGIDYLQMGMLIEENKHLMEITNKIFTDYIMEIKKVIKDFDLAQASNKSIISMTKNLIENKVLYSVHANEFYAQLLKQIIFLQPNNINIILLYHEMDNYINHLENKKFLQSFLPTLWYTLIKEMI